MKKKILCLCSCLNCDSLPFQILNLLDFTLGSYGHHLTTVQVRTCPLIFIFSSIHGITAPQTVYCPVCQKFILVFPDNILKLRLITQPLKCFLGKFHIDTFVFAVTRLIAVRFKIIHSDDNLRQFTVRSFLFLSSTSSQHKTASQKKCSNANSFSPGTGVILSIFSHIQFLFYLFNVTPKKNSQYIFELFPWYFHFCKNHFRLYHCYNITGTSFCHIKV